MTPTPDPDEATPSIEPDVAELVVSLRKDGFTLSADTIERLASEKARLVGEVWDAAKAMSDINREAVTFSDRAERAEAERDALKAELDKWKEVTKSYCERQEDLHRRAQKAEARADKAEADLSALKQRVAEVIEPFAEAASHLHPSQPDDGLTLDGLEVSAWRRAAELHASLRSSEGQPTDEGRRAHPEILKDSR